MQYNLEIHNEKLLPVDASSLQPLTLLGKTAGEVARVPVRVGKEHIALGEICSIEKTDLEPDGLRLGGMTGRLHRIGFEMNGGQIWVEGDTGVWTGSGMQAGKIVVQGSAGDGAGAGMSGGLLVIEGSAGEQAGGARMGQEQGMRGGSLVIWGNAGRCAGERMRRGLIDIRGDCGEQAGLGMLAGTILVGGCVEKHAGLDMLRGSLVASGCKGLLPGFYRACREEFVWLRLLLKSLDDRGFPYPLAWKDYLFTRYNGHHTRQGKGEILLHEATE